MSCPYCATKLREKYENCENGDGFSKAHFPTLWCPRCGLQREMCGGYFMEVRDRASSQWLQQRDDLRGFPAFCEKCEHSCLDVKRWEYTRGTVYWRCPNCRARSMAAPADMPVGVFFG